MDQRKTKECWSVWAGVGGLTVCISKYMHLWGFGKVWGGVCRHGGVSSFIAASTSYSKIK